VSDGPSLLEHFQIIATSPQPRQPTRVLKDGETFAVFDEHGDLTARGLGEQGIYHLGTRHLSGLVVALFGQRPLLLGSSVRTHNDLLAIDLTNPDVPAERGGPLARELLHVHRSIVLWDGVCHQVFRFANFAPAELTVPVTLVFEADYADIFEVRGTRRPRRGRLLPPVTERGRVTLGYVGLDGVERRTEIGFNPVPDWLSGPEARFVLRVPRDENLQLTVTIACRNGEQPVRPHSHATAVRSLVVRFAGSRERSARVTSGNRDLDAWARRSWADLVMMTTDTSLGRYPYAGVPWFSAPFGRDGIITALQVLWPDPGLARGVLAFLADTQATTRDPSRDAEPGKILHEMRHGEMAALGEIPFGRYYGSVDATPLFVLLAGEYLKRTGDLELLTEVATAIERALEWMTTDGDPDGDGFVEYHRRSAEGLVQQGWKDSGDSVFHEDGSLAEGPIALCEVQAYTYGALMAAADIAVARSRPAEAADLRARAERLRQHFEEAFWLPDLSTYALALDGRKQPCRVVSSNAGHCLLTGICAPERAAAVARRLMEESSFSGWGIRTVASGQRRYNPMSYHNGSVWPHDNALVALGMARAGCMDESGRVLDAMLDCSDAVALRRLPELLCGFHRREGEGPTLYPVACAPQAWASGSVFMLLQAVLGLSIDAARREVRLTSPTLPESLPFVRLENLRVADAVVDLTIERGAAGARVRVDRQVGEMNLVHDGQA